MSSPRVPKESHVVIPETQYMGNPCKRGHDGLRFRSNGTCVECERERMRSPKYRERKNERYRNDPQYREKNRKRDHKRADDPAYRRKRAIYMMYWRAQKKREEYGNKGYTLGNDDQEGCRGGNRTVAV